MKYKYEFYADDGFEAGCCYNCPLSYYTEDDCDLICVLNCRYDECPLEKVDQKEERNMIENNNNNRICNTCCKSDVCMYKEELSKAVQDIVKISDRINVFIDADIKCKKWFGIVSNNR